MKQAILAVVVFALASVGSTLYVVKTAPPPVVPTLAQDTVGTQATGSLDSASPPAVAVTVPVQPVGPDTSDVSPTAPPAPNTVDVVAPTPSQADSGPRVAEAPDGPSNEERAEAVQGLARIIGQMKPEEAAPVLTHMTDDELEGIMRSLGARKAAALLVSLPEQRAAALARRLLVPKPQGGV